MSVRSLRYNSLMVGQAKYRSASTDRDAAAFLEAAGIYKSDQRKAIYELVRLLKQYGLWSKMKAIYPFIGGTATTHKWNLKDPRDLDAAFRLSFAGGWTHSSTGALPNGTNAYADTFLAPNPDLTQYDTHASLYSRTNANALSFDIGASNTGSTQIISIYARFAGNALADTGNYLTSRISVAVADSLGLYTITRTSSSSLCLYKNGAEIGSNTTTDTANLPTEKINLAAVFLSGTYQQFGQRQTAFASIGSSMNATEAALLHSAVDKYQRLLSRNV